MNIVPASISEPRTFAPSSYLEGDDEQAPTPIADEDMPNSAAFSAAGFTASLQSGVAALERRFANFTQELTRELAALERRFSAALRSIAGAARNADAQSSDQACAAAAASPAPLSRRNPYDGIIRRAAARNRIDPELVSAVVRQESGFRADAVSEVGAVGLMQLMPSTAKDLGVTDSRDATQNVEAGTRLLRQLLDRYGGRVELALAAYNAGPAAVDRYGGVPPYPETQSYVRAILAQYRESALESG